MVRRWAAILGLALGILGCSDSGLPELGAGLSAEFACPCAAGFECDPVKKVCVTRGLVDAGGADQAGGDGAGDALADADAEVQGDAPDVALADLDGLAEVEASVDVDAAELAETVGEIDAAELDVAEVGDADVEVDVGEDGSGDVEPADDVEADIAAEVEAGGADACVAVAELCNNKDDNCDGETDNGVQAVDTECLKLGVCASGTVGATCSAGKWLCSYSSVQFYEAATEITCDGLDNDCDGQTDEDFALGVQTLGGSCGVGACAGGKVACSADKKGLACDSSAKAAKESCNGKDDDCDGKTDEEFTYTVASSGAILAIGAPCGGGTCGVGAVECTPGKTDQATCSTDPNGSQVQGGSEICNDLDDDCDGQTDEGCDQDKDGFCTAALVAVGKPKVCPKGGGDCDDDPAKNKDASLINPGASELCDGIDNNCAAGTDEIFKYTEPTGASLGVGSACGLGECGKAVAKVVCGVDKVSAACPGFVPKAEVCDNLDNNCDGKSDEGCDDDGDKFCDAGMALVGASATCPSGGGDCNDDPVKWGGAINPGKVESCATAGVDDNCDGKTDGEGAQNCANLYADADLDGYGAGSAKCLCKAGDVPGFTATVAGDCNDQVGIGKGINPGATEVCGGGVDENCSGLTDEGCLNANGCPPSGAGATCGNGEGSCVDGLCQYADAQGHKWTLVPAGKFWMGCNPAVDPTCASNANENPQHEVELSAYWIGVYEVTAEVYKKCVTAGASGCTAPSTTGGADYSTYGAPGKEQHPVNFVSWAQAESVCKWLGGDLPSEAQWEKAARGGCEVYAGKDCKASQSTYPWGNTEPICGQQAAFCKAKATSAAGTASSAGASSYGAFDMAGNVWEWTRDWYNADFYAKKQAGEKDALNSAPTGTHPYRGGSFYDLPPFPRSSTRHYSDPSLAAFGLGVRCAKPLAPTGMAHVPAGSFKMGCVPGDGDCAAHENPQHTVTLDAFYIDQTEVTAAAYKKCVDAGKCGAPQCNAGANYATYGVAGREQHPVNCVNWVQADAYCKWTDAKGRLPSEAEWEKAARGGLEGKKYPWGDQLPTCSANQLNSAVWYGLTSVVGCGKASTWPVATGSAKNGYALSDMIGNVYEWTADWYAAEYYASSPTNNPVGPASAIARAFRGTGFATNSPDIRTSARFGQAPPYADYDLGFRCARSLVATTETVCDNLDDNANGQTDEGCDDDGDKYCDAAMTLVGASSACPSGGGDCNDDPLKGGGAINPAAAEQCDDINNDCDGTTDEGCDDDVDGYCDLGMVVVGVPKICPKGTGDCYDVSNLGTLVNPGAKEVCDNVDNNCSKAVDEGCDDDGDQYCDGNLVVLGTPMICPKSAKDKADDCDDTNTKVNPSGTELCDDVDNNCNGLIDEGCDDDKDTYCDALMLVAGAPKVCISTKGTATPSPGNDCNDDPAKFGFSVNPGKIESCATPGVDDNCDGKVDSEGAQNCTNLYADADLDGYGAGGAKCLCKPGDLATFTAVVPGDCNDNVVSGKTIFPGAKENCGTAADDNCSGGANDENGIACIDFYLDADQDTFGAASKKCLCGPDPTSKYTAPKAGDCVDTDTFINPAAPENCATAADDNCNANVNDIGATGCKPYYDDADGDGYGAGLGKCVCKADPSKQFDTTNNTDCNDDPATGKLIFPGNKETCATAYDDNCDLDTNEENATNCKDFYLDTDGDGYGTSLKKCYCGAETVTKYSATKTGDCNDNAAAGGGLINPGKAEICNDVDDNCSGTDEGCDDDADGYCDSTMSVSSTPGRKVCIKTTLVAGKGDDCNDAASGGADFNPGKAELCNNKDDNCNGQIDDSVWTSLWKPTDCDTSKNGKGVCTTSAIQAVATCVAGVWKCEYANIPVYLPTEVTPSQCDNKDNDCDGATDESCVP